MLPELIQSRNREAFDLLVEVRRDLYRYDAKNIAREVGVSVSTIMSFRSGRTVWPRPQTLMGILEAMDYRLVMVKGRPNVRP